MKRSESNPQDMIPKGSTSVLRIAEVAKSSFHQSEKDRDELSKATYSTFRMTRNKEEGDPQYKDVMPIIQRVVVYA